MRRYGPRPLDLADARPDDVHALQGGLDQVVGPVRVRADADARSGGSAGISASAMAEKDSTSRRRQLPPRHSHTLGSTWAAPPVVPGGGPVAASPRPGPPAPPGAGVRGIPGRPAAETGGNPYGGPCLAQTVRWSNTRVLPGLP